MMNSTQANAAEAIAVVPLELVRGLRRSEYEQLVVGGAFGEERVELLEGTICRMSPHGPRHDGTLDILVEKFGALGNRAKLRVQSAFAASDGSEPEPDLALVPKQDYRTAHPQEAFLIVEVADASLERDRQVKARIYAGSQVQEYWVVNLRDSTLIAFRVARGGVFERVTTHRAGEVVSPEAFPDWQLALAELF